MLGHSGSDQPPVRRVKAAITQSVSSSDRRALDGVTFKIRVQRHHPDNWLLVRCRHNHLFFTNGKGKVKIETVHVQNSHSSQVLENFCYARPEAASASLPADGVTSCRSWSGAVSL